MANPEIRAQIFRAFGRRYEGSACMFDLINEVRFPVGMKGREQQEVLQSTLDELVREGKLRIVEDPSDERDYADYRIYQLA